MIASGIIYKNNRYLMVKQHKHGRTFWNFPGGYVEEGESPEQAYLREILEETGFTARILDSMGQKNNNTYLYLAEILSGSMKLEEGLLDIAWVAEEETDKWDAKTIETLQHYKDYKQSKSSKK